MASPETNGTGVTVLGRLRAAASLLKSRSELAAAMGLTFGGKRNLYEALGYKRTLEPADYRARYARNGIARRIVNAEPMATWRTPPDVFEDEDPNVHTEFEDQFAALAQRLKIWSVFLRADRMAGIGRYAIVLIGVRDGGQLSDPLERVSGSDAVLFLAPYPEHRATIKSFDSDPTSDRFGLPNVYAVDLLGDLHSVGGTTVTRRAQEVHHSRVLHVSDDLLEDNVYGTPRLEPVWNLLDDLEKLTGGSAEAYWQTADRGMHANIDADATLDPADESALSDEIDDYMHHRRRWIRTKGMTLQSLGAEGSDPSGAGQLVIQQISGATGIPQRILLGSERGALASEQDRENWADRIEARQQNQSGPDVLLPFIHRLVGLGALPQPKEITVDWSRMAVLSETEQALVLERRANATRTYGMRESASVIAISEARERLGLPAERPDGQPAPLPTSANAMRSRGMKEPGWEGTD